MKIKFNQIELIVKSKNNLVDNNILRLNAINLILLGKIKKDLNYLEKINLQENKIMEIETKDKPLSYYKLKYVQNKKRKETRIFGQLFLQNNKKK